jgi:hypothetical protein
MMLRGVDLMGFQSAKLTLKLDYNHPCRTLKRLIDRILMVFRVQYYLLISLVQSNVETLMKDVNL